MSEELSNNPDYLEQHPEAIENVDKAHTLALAGYELESESAELRTEAVASLGETAFSGATSTTAEVEAARHTVDRINRNNRIVDTIYAHHGQAYDDLHATKR